MPRKFIPLVAFAVVALSIAVVAAGRSFREGSAVKPSTATGGQRFDVRGATLLELRDATAEEGAEVLKVAHARNGYRPLRGIVISRQGEIVELGIPYGRCGMPHRSPRTMVAVYGSATVAVTFGYETDQGRFCDMDLGFSVARVRLEQPVGGRELIVEVE